MSTTTKVLSAQGAATVLPANSAVLTVDGASLLTPVTIAAIAAAVFAATMHHSSGDFNDFTTPGFHTMSGSGNDFQNVPTNNALSRSIMLVTPVVANSFAQIYFNTNRCEMIFRTNYDGAWTVWNKFTTINSGGKHLPLRKLQTFCRQERRAAA